MNLSFNPFQYSKSTDSEGLGPTANVGFRNYRGTGVPRSYEPRPPYDSTVGLYLGLYGSPLGGGLFPTSEVPLYASGETGPPRHIAEQEGDIHRVMVSKWGRYMPTVCRGAPTNNAGLCPLRPTVGNTTGITAPFRCPMNLPRGQAWLKRAVQIAQFVLRGFNRRC